LKNRRKKAEIWSKMGKYGQKSPKTRYFKLIENHPNFKLKLFLVFEEVLVGCQSLDSGLRASKKSKKSGIFNLCVKR